MTDTGPCFDRAMVLAAGLGLRMRPLTLTRPKPLIEVAGKALIDHVLDRLEAAGVETAVVNVHHLAEQVEAHLARRRAPKILVSDERDALLDSGGGVRKALPLLGERPFIVCNSDSFWLEGERPALRALFTAWNPDRMDILLLLAPLSRSIGYEGKGDYALHPGGGLARRRGEAGAPFVYAGVSIIKPHLFGAAPDGPFSLNLLFDEAEKKGRLFGQELEGQWLHVGTPGGILEAESRIARSADFGAIG